MAKSVTSSYVPQADLIRIIAIFGVVSIHLVYAYYSRPDFLGGSVWWINTILNAFSRISIPLFIMLSGYLMIPKAQSFRSILTRTFKRIVVPLFFWFGFYIWWMARFHDVWFSPQEIVSMIWKSNMYNYYFLVIMIGLYLLLPVIQNIIRKQQRRLLWFLTLLSFGVGMVVYAAPYFIVRDQTVINSLTIWIPYVGYFLLGYLLKDRPRSVKLWWGIFGASLLITIFLSYLNVMWRGMGINTFWRSSGVAYFDEYLSPHVIIMAVSAFQVLLHSVSIKRFISDQSMQSLLQFVAKAAFPMYLIHGFVIDLMYKNPNFQIDQTTMSLVELFVLQMMIVFGVSFIVSSILVRLPVIKWTFGEK